MQEKVKNLIEKNEKVAGACVFCKAIWRVILILLPAAVSAYLIIKHDDKIVIGVGVVLALYALYNLWLDAYNASKKANK